MAPPITSRAITRYIFPMESVAAANREATEAWDGPLFDRFSLA